MNIMFLKHLNNVEPYSTIKEPELLTPEDAKTLSEQTQKFIEESKNNRAAYIQLLSDKYSSLKTVWIYSFLQCYKYIHSVSAAYRLSNKIIIEVQEIRQLKL